MSRGARTRPSTLVGAWVGNGLVTDFSSYESIATTTVGAGGQATITFSSIPSTYKHLQVRMLVKSSGATDACDMRFNSDTGNNYAYHELYGTGSSAGSAASAPRSAMPLVSPGIASSSTNMFSIGVVDILDYADTNKNKTIRNIGGYDLNGSGAASLVSNVWLNTSAISTITIYLRASTNFGQYSHFALYGIKG